MDDWQLDKDRRDLVLSEKQREEEREEQELADKLNRSLATVAQTYEGYDVFFYILKTLGVGKACSEDVRSIAMHNVGMRFLERIGSVAPNEARQLLAALYGLN